MSQELPVSVDDLSSLPFISNVVDPRDVVELEGLGYVSQLQSGG